MFRFDLGTVFCNFGLRLLISLKYQNRMALTNKLTTSVASVVGYGNSRGAVSCQLSKVNFRCSPGSIAVSVFVAILVECDKY